MSSNKTVSYLVAGSLQLWINLPQWRDVTRWRHASKWKHSCLDWQMGKCYEYWSSWRKKEEKYTEERSVTVHNLWPYGDAKDLKDEYTDDVSLWCKVNGWKYVIDANVQGTEDECIVFFYQTSLSLLPGVLQSSKESSHYSYYFLPGYYQVRHLIPVHYCTLNSFYRNREKLKPAVDHCSLEYQCPLSQSYLSKCNLSKWKYLGQQILRRVIISKGITCNSCGLNLIHGVRCFKCTIC